MKRGIMLIAAIGLLALGFWGCESSSEPSGGNGTPVYYPLNVGNWWKYVAVEVDSTGTEKPETQTTDSSVVIGTAQLEGKQAAVVVSYDSANATVDTSYLYADANAVWAYFGEDSLAFGETGTEVQVGWIKIADFQVNQWDIVTLDIHDTVDFQQGSKLIFKTLKMTGHNLGTQSVTVAGQTYQAVLIEITGTIEMAIDFGFGQQDVTANIVQRTWYAQGVGPVQAEDRIDLDMGIAQQFLGGSNRKLVKYHVTL